MKTVLSIAGSDPSGGAGIQADLKTISAHGLYGMSVITALTAQNTMGVSDIFPVPADFFEKQLDSVLCDIFPDAVKIGMIPNKEIAEMIGTILEKYNVKNIVSDTVMISTSGRRLMESGTLNIFLEKILKRSALITPNIPEAEILSEITINSVDDMKKAAEIISRKTGAAVLVKGGHLDGAAADILFDGNFYEYVSKRINNPNTHGTGCTLSSATACGFAAGKTIPESVSAAKEYITKTIKYGLDIGHGTGPLFHAVK